VQRSPMQNSTVKQCMPTRKRSTFARHIFEVSTASYYSLRIVIISDTLLQAMLIWGWRINIKIDKTKPQDASQKHSKLVLL
jgi:hypothetical protein